MPIIGLTAVATAKYDPALAAALRALRVQRGLTQERLALDADVTTSALGRVERGLANPTWRTLKRIIAALGVSLTELAIAIENETPEENTTQLLGNPASVRRLTHRCANERTSLSV
jgi:transcriptional regulator with XRE-family HTH domain